MTGNNDAVDTLWHFESILVVVRTLDEKGIAVYHHTYDALIFGSWVLEAGTRHRRIRVIYDGKERQIRCLSASASDSRTSLEWLEHVSLRLDDDVKPDGVATVTVDLIEKHFRSTDREL